MKPSSAVRGLFIGWALFAYAAALNAQASPFKVPTCAAIATWTRRYDVEFPNNPIYPYQLTEGWVEREILLFADDLLVPLAGVTFEELKGPLASQLDRTITNCYISDLRAWQRDHFPKILFPGIANSMGRDRLRKIRAARSELERIKQSLSVSSGDPVADARNVANIAGVGREHAKVLWPSEHKAFEDLVASKQSGLASKAGPSRVAELEQLPASLEGMNALARARSELPPLVASLPEVERQGLMQRIQLRFYAVLDSIVAIRTHEYQLAGTQPTPLEATVQWYQQYQRDFREVHSESRIGSLAQTFRTYRRELLKKHTPTMRTAIAATQTPEELDQLAKASLLPNLEQGTPEAEPVYRAMANQRIEFEVRRLLAAGKSLPLLDPPLPATALKVGPDERTLLYAQLAKFANTRKEIDALSMPCPDGLEGDPLCAIQTITAAIASTLSYTLTAFRKGGCTNVSPRQARCVGIFKYKVANVMESPESFDESTWTLQGAKWKFVGFVAKEQDE